MSEQKAPETKKQGFFAALWSGIKKAAKAVWTAIKWVGKAITNTVQFVAKAVLAVVRFAGTVLSLIVAGIALVVSTILFVLASVVSFVVLVIYKLVQLVVLTLSTPAMLFKSREAAKTDWTLYWLSWLPRNFTTFSLAEVALRESVREQDRQQAAQEAADNVHHISTAQQKKGGPTPKQRRSHYRQRTAEARRVVADAQAAPATP